MIKIDDLEIPDVKLIDGFYHEDFRGGFAKIFHQDFLAAHGIDAPIAEVFYSTSHKGVLRGLHFQSPPASHVKFVCCISGAIQDVGVDLRRNSKFYGQAVSRELSGERPQIMVMPKGFAHGFLALSEWATVLYMVSTVHSPAHDAGIRWDSIPFDWKSSNPIVSARDAAFPPLDAFESPF